MKTKEVLVTYRFRIEYQSVEHLRMLEEQLMEYPITNSTGAAVVKRSGEVRGYQCTLLGAAQVQESRQT